MPVHRHPVALSKPDGSFAAIPLDQELIVRLRSSYTVLRANKMEFGEVFYSKLFAAVPAVRPLFKSDPRLQAAKLVASLDFIVQHLSKPEENIQMLQALGQRHVGYGAKAEHYPVVVSIMIESMREVLGSHADESILDEWRTALDLVSKQMIAGSVSD